MQADLNPVHLYLKGKLFNLFYRNNNSNTHSPCAIIKCCTTGAPKQSVWWTKFPKQLNPFVASPRQMETFDSNELDDFITITKDLVMVCCFILSSSDSHCHSVCCATKGCCWISTCRWCLASRTKLEKTDWADEDFSWGQNCTFALHSQCQKSRLWSLWAQVRSLEVICINSSQDPDCPVVYFVSPIESSQNFLKL